MLLIYGGFFMLLSLINTVSFTTIPVTNLESRKTDDPCPGK
jgi:hypothetical protein